MLDTLRSWLDKPINVDIHIKAIEVSKEESYMHDNCIQDSDQTEVMVTNFDYPNSVAEKLVDKPFVNYPAKTVTEQAAGVFFLSEILESSTSSLEQNTASAPTNQKKYPCELCDKHFLTKRSLKSISKIAILRRRISYNNCITTNIIPIQDHWLIKGYMFFLKP